MKIHPVTTETIRLSPLPDIPQFILDSTNCSWLLGEFIGSAVLRCWAPWCMSCRTLEQELLMLLREHPGAFQLVELNVDRNYGVARDLGVKYLPELIVLHDGQEVNRIIGEIADLKSVLQQYIPALRINLNPIANVPAAR